jgi:hypothetical protein
MRDTPPAVQERYEKLLMGRSAAERVRMACSMHDTAKAIVRAGIPDDAWETQDNLKIEVFRRFYRLDFSEEEMGRILDGMRRWLAKQRTRVR